MSIAYPSPFPYIFLIAICLVVVLVCFAKFSSLRIYRKKRNLLFYSILFFVFSLLVYQSYDLFLGPSCITFSLDNGDKKFYAERINTFSVSSRNVGMRIASFTLILKSVNVSFTPYTQQVYPHSNSTTIRIPFTFSEGGSDTKLVQFKIDENVKTFEVYPYIEGNVIVSFSSVKAQGLWNDATKSFALSIVPGPCV